MSEFSGRRVPTAGHTPDDDLTGYRVIAPDGRAGRVSKYSRDLGRGFLVVRTGNRFFGRDVVLASDVVVGVRHADRTVRLSRTRSEIRSAPAFDVDTYLGDPAHRDQLGGRHGSGH
ncbi:PRC-barrel domain containing protein [Streptomyces sp. NPDC014995]|uniref:PRC-barrel domain containing protein n=1 Tax=Streptomyces sp. NPDC014995 TaxID=3364936 RepID=UPI0036FDA2D3